MTPFTFSILKRMVGGDLEIAEGLPLETALKSCCHLSNEPQDLYLLRNEQTLEEITLLEIDDLD